MTDRKELEVLIAKVRAAGATVTVRLDADGYIDGVTVAGIAGIGNHEMGPLSFAERMRAHFAN